MLLKQVKNGRGVCKGKNSKISWTQVETGSTITADIQVVLQGDNSVGEFYSIAITNNHQKADTGTKMIHLGKIRKVKLSQKEFQPVKLTTLIEDL